MHPFKTLPVAINTGRVSDSISVRNPGLYLFRMLGNVVQARPRTHAFDISGYDVKVILNYLLGAIVDLFLGPLQLFPLVLGFLSEFEVRE